MAMLMAATLVVGSFTACGKTETPATTPKEETTTETKTPADDTAAEGDTAAESTALGAATLKVWGSQEDQEMLQTMVDNFKALHPEDALDISLGVVSEADAKTELLKDPTVAADVFSFATDQLAELQAAGAMYRVTKNKDAIIAANSETSIQGCTIENEIYAYPYSANTFFMFYDKSKYTEDEVKNLNTMMAKDLGKGMTNFSFDFDNGWYNSAFFYGTGAQLFGPDGTDPAQCDFNGENGMKAGQYLIDLAAQKDKFANQDDGLLLSAFQAKTLGATLTGSWNATAIQEALGENYGAAVMPKITLADGTEVQPKSLASFKAYAINSQTKYPEASMALAEYLAGPECQKLRFEKRSFTPTNVELLADKATMDSNIAVAASALEAQSCAVLQPSISQMGNFWAPSEAFGAGILNGEVTSANLQENLDAFVKNVLATLGN